MNQQDVRDDQARSLPPLPEGYHCAITWGIPTEYGGMTNALLHRSRAFIQEAGVPVDVLTFAWSLDYGDIRCELEAAGELIPGLRLRNLWEELGQLTESQLATSKPGKNVVGEFSPIARVGGSDRRNKRRGPAPPGPLRFRREDGPPSGLFPRRTEPSWPPIAATSPSRELRAAGW